MGIPRTTFIKPGDTLWLKDSTPMRQVVVKQIIYGLQPPYKDMLWVEDKDTKEQLTVLVDWVTDLNPAEAWDREEDTSFHSLDDLKKKEIQLKDKELLSSEKAEKKMPHEILASVLAPVSERVADQLGYLVAEKLAMETGADDSMIDGFLTNASCGMAPDGTFWVYDPLRRLSFRLDASEQIINLNYYNTARKVRATSFFEAVDTSMGLVITAVKDNYYLLNFQGTKILLDEDDLGLLCADWKLNYSSIKSSLQKCGRWSL